MPPLDPPPPPVSLADASPVLFCYAHNIYSLKRAGPIDWPVLRLEPPSRKEGREKKQEHENKIPFIEVREEREEREEEVVKITSLKLRILLPHKRSERFHFHFLIRSVSFALLQEPDCMTK